MQRPTGLTRETSRSTLPRIFLRPDVKPGPRHLRPKGWPLSAYTPCEVASESPLSVQPGKPRRRGSKGSACWKPTLRGPLPFSLTHAAPEQPLTEAPA
jgi:hypothetical protein